jgi:hypothetical protein
LFPLLWRSFLISHNHMCQSLLFPELFKSQSESHCLCL